tara:strand:- start:361 stop:606 length:246 start_codon:yes stop_codon:yes gene_type:complete
MKHRAKKIYLEGYLYRGYVIQRRQQDYVYWSIGEPVDFLGNYEVPTEKSDFYSVRWNDATDTLREAKYLIDTSPAYCGDKS